MAAFSSSRDLRSPPPPTLCGKDRFTTFPPPFLPSPACLCQPSRVECWTLARAQSTRRGTHAPCLSSPGVAGAPVCAARVLRRVCAATGEKGGVEEGGQPASGLELTLALAACGCAPAMETQGRRGAAVCRQVYDGGHHKRAGGPPAGLWRRSRCRDTVAARGGAAAAPSSSRHFSIRIAPCRRTCGRRARAAVVEGGVGPPSQSIVGGCAALRQCDWLAARPAPARARVVHGR